MALPKTIILVGYEEVFNEPPPLDRLTLVQHICRRNLITELAGLNYLLKPKDSLNYNNDISLQDKILHNFFRADPKLYNQYSVKLNNLIKRNPQLNKHLIISRQTCLFAIEEITQSQISIIDEFRWTKDDWEILFKYILSVNTAIADIGKENDDSPMNFESLNPKLIPLNELAIGTDPFYSAYRGYQLFNYLSTKSSIQKHFNDYINQNYSCSFDFFVYEIMRIYLSNKHENPNHDFYHIVHKMPKTLFDAFCGIYPSAKFERILSIKKYPFFKSRESEYVLIDNILLLDKLYSQFINDFWFDYLKSLSHGNGKSISIENYKSIIGYFFEEYFASIIDFCFEKKKFYSVKKFKDLERNIKGGKIEIADLYIRYDKKIIIGQVKSSTIYDNEKFSGDLDSFYKEDRNKFFETFGVNQLVESIRIMNQHIPHIDKHYPKNKNLKVFPVLVVNDKVFQTPLMAKIFQDRFRELLNKATICPRNYVHPMSLMHISDWETIQYEIRNKPEKIWDLLKYHSKEENFLPPFYNTINRKGIKPVHSNVINLFEGLINKYGNNNIEEVELK